MPDQEQFLDVIDRDEAETRFRRALNPRPLGVEQIALGETLGRILAENILAIVDVPSFDRSNFDGYAVHAADTFGATELSLRRLKLLPETLEAGRAPTSEQQPGDA
ncbi:MAG TPA: hypothetical protein VM510_14025, partial [Caulifigura sp.]|nr:hypothetical protein [Caulifigura sp.]